MDRAERRADPMGRDMLLEVEGLRVHYGGVEALRGVAVAVADGEVVALLGANGAGKTTTLRAISGVAVPTAGDVRFRGKRIAGARPKAIVAAGIVQVPEGRQLFPRMTVLENLEVGAYLRSDRRAREDLEAVFTHFPVLRERRKQSAGSLSGGKQQMLAIGRALMAGPRLLLLDEPSLGLAPRMVEEIGAIVREINRAGVSILLVEQNAEMALSLAERAYVLEGGQVTISGEAKSLREDERVRRAYLGIA